MAYRTTPKMAERKADRRKALLETAIEVFGEHGYHGTTVPMIVAAAQSSTGSFYFYFRNKEDVFAAALEELGVRITSAINEAIGGAGPFVLLQMRAAVRGLVAFLAQNPEQARILIVESSGLGPRLDGIRREVIASHTRGVERALQGLGQGVSLRDASIAANCWTGAVYQAVFHWLEQPAKGRPSAEHLADEIAKFNLRGIGAPAEPPEA